MSEALRHELDTAGRLARQAGDLVRRFRREGLTVQHKTGADDPVTEADRAASELLMRELAAAFPHDGLLSEEEADSTERLGRERVWLIDPIDGTKEYAEGSPDYCVSIGLAVAGEPVLGVIYAPDTDELFAGAAGLGVTKDGQPAARHREPPYVIATSVTETRRELNDLPLAGMRPSGSTALKLARIAAGEADATFTMSPRAEWDIAAGHALLRAAGAELTRRDGGAVRYNQPTPYLEQGFVAGHPDALAWLQAELLRLGVPSAVLALDADQRGQRRHVRRAGERELAWLVTGSAGGEVQVLDCGGDAFHLERLTRDVRRARDSLR
ncbi:inositol monophosphatase [Deinococcus proteolyticus MRP]|uniref:Inositol monophosphatase n=1 Tax=Deinococcus proteolyticus (strain ATCC 35074 / DSM 20540 / JCM 6276 / NBRC 101906 / NCIMB 13154 / VKM Ac-1939 / CCM 2703 / MRP) TaxID=693977 RepID=F0RMZ1_DEIPM|nr:MULTISPECIES: 3'(2'),5'-bisphosphate nucleotidase CysQ [Deinococcus]ADY26133.1 inositol monophosphatase [Deinococcus proteolyticus MRP]MCY1702253.1 3'(2'),5'-bisphosphate nucleotidase CysQ [Deinococcus sp. SL84]